MRASAVPLLVLLLASLAAAGPVLLASPDHVQVYDECAVAWAAIPNPGDRDVIALFSPATSDASAQPLLAVNVSIVAPVGAMKFALLNMRDTFQFRYLQPVPGSNYTNFTTVAVSNVITTDPAQPMQGHLALTANITEMRVMWISGLNATGVVQWGTSSGTYQWNATCTPYTYSVDQICGDWALQFFRDPGFIFDAVMTNLAPLTKYYYRFGSAAGWSNESYFVSAPQQVDPNMAVNILAFGDLGTGDCEDMPGWCEPPSLSTTRWLAQEAPTNDLVVHIGDISYAVGYAHRWEQFFYQISPTSMVLPWMVAIGNHEYDWGIYNTSVNTFNSLYNGTDSHGECGMPYHARFNMPGVPPFTGLEEKPSITDQFYYSFEYGPVHFTLMSTEHNYSAGSDQYNWLVKDLAAVNRSRTPWLIFGGHRPMYISTFDDGLPAGDQTVAQELRESLEVVLFKYQVDLAIWGHCHLYERTCPVYNHVCRGNNTMPAAPLHTVIGMAGMGASLDIVFPRPAWSMTRYIDEYGYSKIMVANATHLHMQFMSNAGIVQDDFWIVNEHHLSYLNAGRSSSNKLRQ